jgi:riboflavin kinase / FMN adenylyltransferase
MDVFHGPTTRRLREPVVAIGNFDGVHVGHRALFAAAMRAARARAGEAVVLTFEPHPARVLAPALAPPLVTPLPRKLELIDDAGLDAAVVLPFTTELASHSASSFVGEVLLEGLGAREVVVGHDFTYGRKREGTIEILRAEGASRGFGVQVIPAVTVEGLVVSSTKIRELLHEGNVGGARMLLGRPFDIDGRVVRGAGRGRTIGVPTANVAVEGELLPHPGVYAGTASLLEDGRVAWTKRAAINLGTNPTFGGGALSLEAHVLDHEGDLYDRRLRVAFHARLRGEERFSDVAALIAQIKKDIDAVKVRMETDS